MIKQTTTYLVQADDCHTVFSVPMLVGIDYCTYKLDNKFFVIITTVHISSTVLSSIRHNLLFYRRLDAAAEQHAKEFWEDQLNKQKLALCSKQN